jgi:hypothetical protein
MDPAAIRARFENIKRRALEKAEEEIQRARIPLAADGPMTVDDIARWPRRPPRQIAKLPRGRSRRRARPAVADSDSRARNARG